MTRLWLSGENSHQASLHGGQVSSVSVFANTSNRMCSRAMITTMKQHSAHETALGNGLSSKPTQDSWAVLRCSNATISYFAWTTRSVPYQGYVYVGNGATMSSKAFCEQLPLPAISLLSGIAYTPYAVSKLLE